MILTALALVCLYAPAKPIPMQTITDQVNGISFQIPADWQRQTHTEMRQVTAFKGDRIGLSYRRTHNLYAGYPDLHVFKYSFMITYGSKLEKTRVFKVDGMTVYAFQYKTQKHSQSIDNHVLLFGHSDRTFEIKLNGPSKDKKDTTRLLKQIVKTLKVNPNPNPTANKLLLTSIEKQDTKQLEQALAANADPNLKTDGLFVLEHTLLANQLGLAETLLKAGATANLLGYKSFYACAAKPEQVALIERYEPKVANAFRTFGMQPSSK